MQTGIRTSVSLQARKRLKRGDGLCWRRVASPPTRFVEQAISTMARAAGRDRRQFGAPEGAGSRLFWRVESRLKQFAPKRSRFRPEARASAAALLNTQAANIARERTLPIAAEMEKLATRRGERARRKRRFQNEFRRNGWRWPNTATSALARTRHLRSDRHRQLSCYSP